MRKGILRLHFLLILVIVAFGSMNVHGSTPEPATGGLSEAEPGQFRLKNEKVTLTVVMKENRLSGDTIQGNPAWFRKYNCPVFSISSDADFGLDFTWTDWQAPNKIENADNPVTFSNNDLVITTSEVRNFPGGGGEISLSGRISGTPLLVTLTYHLNPDAFYYKRKIAVKDTIFGHHFLNRIIARRSICMATSNSVEGKTTTLNPVVAHAGLFGQPVAIQFQPSGSSFYGIEYPAGVNTIEVAPSGAFYAQCSQDFGMKVGRVPVESEWVVVSVIPASAARNWFFSYLDDIRVAPAKPYTLYNSWYDLRSPEYPGVQPDHVMNEKNSFEIIRLFRKNMIEKHKIQLDAFVLDDGWDYYDSDWVLRKETFPNGLKPIADTLKKMGTNLGIWFGPTGGYSFRMKRVSWMKQHGYEVVGETRDNAMLCLAGKNYSQLFEKRVTDMVRNDGMAYFKWDGIQFSCSEPDHGHSTGIYSRRAVLESVIDKCKAVRTVNPDVYLNITSGTWLSPWWVKYANQIWMQGEDYGYANVPSITQRDAAITYKDFVLYDNFVSNDRWFPISNLMTHGIIKGKLERLGGEDDPLDKFTNDVVFYLARGISMYELYISPDLLNEGEWNAIGSAINWAKDRYGLLSRTCMTGGNPMNREPYGYIHSTGKHAIIALRNPTITQGALSVALSEENGFDTANDTLVLEKIYPYHFVSPILYHPLENMEISLEGFETAIYEVYPLREAKVPLLAGAKFNVTNSTGNSFDFTMYGSQDEIKILNPEVLKDDSPDAIVSLMGSVNDRGTQVLIKSVEKPVIKTNGKEAILKTRFSFDPSLKDATFAVLLQPDKGYEETEFPDFNFFLEGKEVNASVEKEKGLWAWEKTILSHSSKELTAKITNGGKAASWKGKAMVYLVCRQVENGKDLQVKIKGNLVPHPILPLPFEKGIFEKTILLGEVEVVVK